MFPARYEVGAISTRNAQPYQDCILVQRVGGFNSGYFPMAGVTLG